MPATRLLVLADPKMLLALANGLREGAKFDVLTLPFGDAGAAAAAQRADALAVFYGPPGRSLQEVVQELAPQVRSRGGIVVGVLQRDQVAQRDDCFRAGASDLLFMPLPKEQFVSRLAASVALSYASDPGVSAAVQVGARGNLVPLAQATVTTGGIHAAAALPFQPGETVRISWANFECWGLVARASPAQVRFAGLAPDEEARIREWAQKNGAPLPAARAEPAAAPAPAPKPAAPKIASPAAPPAAADRPVAKTAPPAPTVAAPSAPVRAPSGSTGPRPVTKPLPAAPAPKPSPSPSLADLVGEPPERPEPAPRPAGPAWPTVPDVEVCKRVGIALVQGDKKAPPGTSPELAAAAKKVLGVLNVGERTALEKAKPDSHFGAALGARIVLELARAEAQRLVAAQPPPVVDDASVKAIAQIADAAAARLQEEVEVVIGRADVDNLQLLTVANAALSRDVLLFKETADRLRGIAAAPRLGAGALDPDIVLPGQLSRPAKPVDRPIVKAELREFAGLGEADPRKRRKKLVAVCVLAIAGAVVNLMFFAYPRITEMREQIPGVSRIEISGKTARVTIAADFAEQEGRAVAMLTSTLRERGVERAVLVQRNGAGAGQIAVRDGKTYGVPAPVKRGDVLPIVPTQAAQPPATDAAPQSTASTALPAEPAAPPKVQSARSP